MTNSKFQISGSTHVVGVCGHGIRYTLSPAMHNAAFQALGLDYVYVTFDVAPGRASDAVAGIRGLGLSGVNVTKPLKTEMLPYLDEVSDEARRIGSVNTIVNREGYLYGTTTDGVGLLAALEAFGAPVSGKRVLILGAGGAARAACAMSVQAGAAQTIIAARNLEKAVETASVGPADAIAMSGDALGRVMRSAQVIINAVPADLDLDVNWFSADQTVYDTRYDVADTLLLQVARSRGAKTSNGLDMLLYQGAAAFELWTQKTAPIEVMRLALIEGLKERQG